MLVRCSIAVSLLFLGTGVSRADDAPKPSKDAIAFFETHIRPVLVERCYSCHSAASGKSKGGLRLDTQANLAKGGDSGPVLVPGDVEKSRLIHAIRWTDADFVMPPRERLSPAQVERFEQWVKMGAPDPRVESGSGPAAKSVDLAAARKWWAFRDVAESPPPAVKRAEWATRKIDLFVLKELEAKGLAPSAAADPRTLIRRVYLDLTGLRPSYEEVEAFARDPSEAAYGQVVEKLLASPQYGQRWGRYWLDVARYGEDNPTSEVTNPPYPFAWRYRDWVIDAINRDVPYDRFVTLQLAADLVPGTPRSDLPATGFLGAGPIYHKDARLSKDVIENLCMDDWDERVDVVSRGLLGLTVACARCHDHKFDPISTRDYYALAGVFASAVAVPRPVADVDPETEARFMNAARRLFQVSYVANLLKSEPGSKPKEAKRKVEQLTLELDRIEAEIAPLKESHPDLHAYLARLDKRPGAPAEPRNRNVGGSTEAFFHGVFEAGLWVDGSDPDVTMLDVRPGQPHDLRILPGGNVAKPTDLAPRGFPAVLAKSDASFRRGSGRLELAERIFTDAAPLAARVIVNRVWGWHFGKPLVETQSDFGAQGDRPTHPELLDDLAARFMASGWSLKWLHREILLSSTYRQASRPTAVGMKLDPGNRLLWRMNPRRLDVEAYRDGLLQAAGVTRHSVRRSLQRSRSGRKRPSHRLRPDQPRADEQRAATVRLPRGDDAQPGPRADDDAVSTALRHEQPVPPRSGGTARPRRRSQVGGREQGSFALSKSFDARSDAQRDRARRPVSRPRLARRLRPGPPLYQRDDLLAMNPLISRRAMLRSFSGGLGSVALASLVVERAAAAPDPAGPPARAKHNILLFMPGGPSQVDLFDPKPALAQNAGQRPASVNLRTERTTGGLLPSPFVFKRHGRSGLEISELLPNLAALADDLCVVRSMYTFNPTHTPARSLFHSGNIAATRPSMGSWISYGLGTENQNLPGFVALAPGGGSGGTRSGFLPARHQGASFDDAVTDPERMIRHLKNSSLRPDEQRRQLDLIQRLNRDHREAVGDDDFLEGRIQAMETAYRMQSEAMDAFDIRGEPATVRAEYGNSPFANGCLLARRLVERGVRTVHVHYGPGQPWDDHGNINQNLRGRCPDMDRASAALIRDLKRRGLLGETAVLWGGEFGRTPVSESGDGRDHNPYGFTMFMAGGGFKGGTCYGATDEFGFPRRRQTRLDSRPARDAAPRARHRSHEAHLPIRGPRLPAHRRVRHGGARHSRLAREAVPSPPAGDRLDLAAK